MICTTDAARARGVSSRLGPCGRRVGGHSNPDNGASFCNEVRPLVLLDPVVPVSFLCVCFSSMRHTLKL